MQIQATVCAESNLIRLGRHPVTKPAAGCITGISKVLCSAECRPLCRFRAKGLREKVNRACFCQVEILCTPITRLQQEVDGIVAFYGGYHLQLQQQPASVTVTVHRSVVRIVLVSGFAKKEKMLHRATN